MTAVPDTARQRPEKRTQVSPVVRGVVKRTAAGDVTQYPTGEIQTLASPVGVLTCVSQGEGDRCLVLRSREPDRVPGLTFKDTPRRLDRFA